MGGDIRLRSAPGAGSEFTVRLYLPAVAAARAGRRRGRRPGAARARAGGRRPRRAPRGAARLLAPLGLAVREAGEGAAVLPALRQWRPQLVLLDLNLPDASGWDLCRRIRAEPAPPQVVIVSANAHQNTEEARLLHGHLGFVSKPVREAELLDMVRRALARRRRSWKHGWNHRRQRSRQHSRPRPTCCANCCNWAPAAGARPRSPAGRTGRRRRRGRRLAHRMLALARSDGAALNASLGEAPAWHPILICSTLLAALAGATRVLGGRQPRRARLPGACPGRGSHAGPRRRAAAPPSRAGRVRARCRAAADVDMRAWTASPPARR